MNLIKQVEKLKRAYESALKKDQPQKIDAALRAYRRALGKKSDH